MVEQNDGVGHVFFESVPGKSSLTPLTGNDRGHAFVFEPPKEARQLHSEDAGIGESREQRLDGVQDNPLRPDRPDRVIQSDEEPLQVVLTRLFDLMPIDADIVDDDFLWAMSAARSKPSEATSAVRSSTLSSKVMNTPRSPNSVAPRTKNSVARRVFPDPAAPQTKVGRPLGSPPPVISSSPVMPVAAFAKAAKRPRVTAGSNATAGRLASFGGGGGLRNRDHYPTGRVPVQALAA